MKLLHEMTAFTIFGGTLTVCGYLPFSHASLDNFFNLS